MIGITTSTTSDSQALNFAIPTDVLFAFLGDPTQSLQKERSIFQRELSPLNGMPCVILDLSLSVDARMSTTPKEIRARVGVALVSRGIPLEEDRVLHPECSTMRISVWQNAVPETGLASVETEVDIASMVEFSNDELGHVLIYHSSNRSQLPIDVTPAACDAMLDSALTNFTSTMADNTASSVGLY